MSFENFCGSQFWDDALTINTDNPDFTDCFEHSVLVYVPVGFLFLFSPVLLYNLRRSSQLPLPWTWRLILRQLITLVLMVLAAVVLFYNVSQNSSKSVPANDYLYPVLEILAMLYIFGLTIGCKRKGFVTSGVIYLTWFLFVLFGWIEFRTKIDRWNKGDHSNTVQFGVYMVFYPLIIVQFLLMSFADTQDPRTSMDRVNPSPEEKASFLNLLTFSYYTQMAYTGYRRALTNEDLWALNDDDSSRTLVRDFEQRWEPRFKKYKRAREAVMNSYNQRKKSYGTMSESSEELLVNNGKGPKLPSEPSIIWVLFLCSRNIAIPAVIFKLFSDLVQFLNPQILKVLIAFVQSTTEPVWRGYIYAVGLLAAQMFYTIILHQYFHNAFVMGMRIRSVLVSALFTKSLRLSNTAKRGSTVGEIVNLMSVDVQRMMDITSYINMLWSSPLQIALALYFLSQELGASVVAGLVVMLILIPLNGVLTNRQKKYQIMQMKAKDERIKLATEMLNSMKVLKLYAWEPSFEEQILQIRQRELTAIRKVSYLRAAFTFVWLCAPFLVSAASFAAYVISDPVNHILTAQTAFVSLSLFNILRFPMTMLPTMITYLVQASVSNKRIRDFLLGDELDPNVIQRLRDDGKTAIEIKDGIFSWEKDAPPTLQNINLHVPKNSLIAVVGQVGAGKSSLVSAMLGEMDKDSGSVTIRGSVAYVPQQAWIQNCSLRDNITFSKNYDFKRYDSVIDGCALKPDLEILPGGDTTEIGEKGINLSGGQKQRVSVARAVYQESDIYLLDDPLSAVDSHVGKHIFDNIIGKNGLLKDKTRILVTHGLGFLREADRIVVMKNGRISEVGTYNELVEAKGAFSEFLENYQQEAKEEEEVDTRTAEEIAYEEKRRARMLRQRSTLMSIDEAGKSVGRSTSRMSGVSGSSKSPRSKSPKGVLLNRQFSNPPDTPSPVRTPNKKGSVGRAISRSLSKMHALSQDNINEDIEELASRAEPEEIIDEDDQVAGTKLIEAEQAATGRVKMAVYLAYMSAIGYIPCLLILIAYGASNGFTVGSNVWLSAWSSDSPTAPVAASVFNVSTPSSTSAVHVPMPVAERLGGYVGLGLAQGLSVLCASLLIAYFTMNASRNLHVKLLHNLLRSPMSFFDVTPIGRIVNRLGKDVDTLDNTLPTTIPAWINCVVSVLANLIVVISATPIFAVVIIPLAIIYYVVQRIYVASSRQLKRLESLSRSPIYSHFQETIQGVSSIRAYRVQQRFVLESEHKVDFNNMAYFPNIVSNRWLAVYLLGLGSFITFFAALFAVIGRSTLSGGLAGLSISNAMSITQTLNWAVRMTSDLETNIVSVERIKEYSETPTEAEWKSSQPPPKSWPTEGVVKFKNYQMRYRPGLDLVLKGVTCGINEKEKIGIVGRTGAGKSSLTLALFRLVEAAGGAILIDGLNIADMGLHELRSKLTIIPQDPVLFTGTLRLNLDPFNASTDDQIWKVLELSHLKEFVSSLPNKLDYDIAEGGENLSVGQRQLVCLARALLRHTRVLILDEATAAVDLETDDLIQQTIRQEFKDSTILTIAHRLNTIMDSTRVIVLDKGTIVEFASPEELLANKQSIFYGMAKDAGLVS